MYCQRNCVNILISLCFAIVTCAWALDRDITPEQNRIPQTHFKLVGQGQMNWLWLKLYQAKLYTPSGNYRPQQRPLMLELIYARSISRELLIKATEKEWQRQKINYQRQWLLELEEIWPDVSPNDSLLLSINSNGYSQFFYNNQFIGSIDDKQFSQAFSAIWLSEKAVKKKLRNQLIGLKS